MKHVHPRVIQAKDWLTFLTSVLSEGAKSISIFENFKIITKENLLSLYITLIIYLVNSDSELNFIEHKLKWPQKWNQMPIKQQHEPQKHDFFLKIHDLLFILIITNTFNQHKFDIFFSQEEIIDEENEESSEHHVIISLRFKLSNINNRLFSWRQW